MIGETDDKVQVVGKMVVALKPKEMKTIVKKSITQISEA